jgi:hypothetical protein
MFPIQRNYWADLKAARSAGLVDGNKNPCKLDLYRFIANHIGAYWQTDSVDELYQNIDNRNTELACVGVAESCIAKPVKRCDRVKVQPPIKRPIVGGLSVATARPVKVAKPKLRVKVN